MDLRTKLAIKQNVGGVVLVLTGLFLIYVMVVLPAWATLAKVGVVETPAWQIKMNGRLTEIEAERELRYPEQYRRPVKWQPFCDWLASNVGYVAGLAWLVSLLLTSRHRRVAVPKSRYPGEPPYIEGGAAEAYLCISSGFLFMCWYGWAMQG